MTRSAAEQNMSFQMQELCQRLAVPYRDARYICERNWLPLGVERDPGRGNHRQLTAAQAMWLAVVLRLKVAGVKTPMAVRIAAFAERIRGMTRNLGWDWEFSPFDGALRTTKRWILEAGDMRYVRFLTDANPSKQGLDEMTWVDMKSRKPVPQAAPVVCTRVDLSALARLLQDRSKAPSSGAGGVVNFARSGRIRISPR
jgi:hypothetical protein